MRKLITIFIMLAVCSSIPMYGNVNSQTEQEAAIAAIDKEVGESDDENILEVANAAKEEIMKDENASKITDIKDLAIYKIKEIKYINEKIGTRTKKLFYDVVIGGDMGLLKHALTLKDAEDIGKEIMGRLEYAIWVYDSAKAEDQTALPSDAQGTAGHTVTIIKGDKTLKLVNPDKVIYGQQ